MAYSWSVMESTSAHERASSGSAMDRATGVRALDIEDGADGVSFATLSGSGCGWPFPGTHNATNACAAAAVLVGLGIDEDRAFDVLAAFRGAGRRFELVGHRGDVAVIDDYAHHPVELEATLLAARARHRGRLVVCFQPHMPWRTTTFRSEFARALGLADVAVVVETYVARGAPDHEASARRIVDEANRLRGTGFATFAETLGDAEALLGDLLKPGDLLLCAGAGPIDSVARALVDPA